MKKDFEKFSDGILTLQFPWPKGFKSYNFSTNCCTGKLSFHRLYDIRFPHARQVMFCPGSYEW